jgi:hypothetical protein
MPAVGTSAGLSHWEWQWPYLRTSSIVTLSQLVPAPGPLRPLLMIICVCLMLVMHAPAGLRGPLPDSLGSLTRLWTLDIVGTSMRCGDTTQQPPPCPVPSWLVQQVCG